MISLPEAVSMIRRPVNTDEACEVIELYVYTRKGVRITMPRPSTRLAGLYRVECEKLMSMYSIAADFLLVLHFRPDLIKTK